MRRIIMDNNSNARPYHIRSSFKPGDEFSLRVGYAENRRYCKGSHTFGHGQSCQSVWHCLVKARRADTAAGHADRGQPGCLTVPFIPVPDWHRQI